ncbi:ScbA/BarX family gamma-butyrolactone biosynthesis protein [Streptomyces sp. NPDC102283]|uniref:ScbA/BarX family gamma-butyrolactone biosynthesis protein n=1 Tax=Streptomyces sp. NPDC102283 TaxID=3366155 RepID=UPI003801CD9D
MAPKEYAHLRHQDRVLIGSWARREPDAFRLTALWPAPTGGSAYDARLVTQTIRQAGLVVAHAEYGAPLTHQTLLYTFNYRAAPGFRAPRGRPLPLTVEVRATGKKQKGRATTALTLDIQILQDGITLFHADSSFGWVSPPAYRRLRGDHHTVDWAQWDVPSPVPPPTVGHTAPTDVLLAPTATPHCWQLRNDTANTLLYDHPVDHVPGLVLIEAALQAAHATGTPAAFHPTEVLTSFDRYVEFDTPCWIEAQPTPPPSTTETTLLITGTQNGRTAFHTKLTGTYR